MLKQAIKKVLTVGLRQAIATKKHNGKFRFLKNLASQAMSEWDSLVTEVLAGFPVEDQFQIIQFMNQWSYPSEVDDMMHSVSGWRAKLEDKTLKDVWISSEEEGQVAAALKVFQTPMPSSNRKGFSERNTNQEWGMSFAPAHDEEGALELIRSGKYKWALIQPESSKHRVFRLVEVTAAKSRSIIPLVKSQEDAVQEFTVLSTISRKAAHPPISVGIPEGMTDAKQVQVGLAYLDALGEVAATEEERAEIHSQKDDLLKDIKLGGHATKPKSHGQIRQARHQK